MRPRLVKEVQPMTLTGKQKAKLKGQAHGIKPVIQVGKAGVEEAQINSIKRALHEHELIKIKFLDYKDHKEEISANIARETGAEIVEIIGNILVLYWENMDRGRRKIRL
jgi:RNA-binding protein